MGKIGDAILGRCVCQDEVAKQIDSEKKDEEW